jgi:glycosyltransferase involved in cell wall biosynthesis
MLPRVPTSRPPVLQVAQPGDGGVAEHVLRLSLGLRERGWPVEVATPPTSAIRAELRGAGIPVHDVPMTRSPGPADLRAARRIRSIDGNGRYAIVHAHSSKAGALARAALPRPGRLVYTPHCFAFATAFSPLRRLVYTAVEQGLVPRSGAIIGVCEWERGQAARLRGASRRMHVVHNGVAACGSPQPAAELIEFKGDGLLAGMVSGLREPKEPVLLVRAAARLASAGGGAARVAIVGNGPQVADVEREIERLGVGDRVRRFPFEGDAARYMRALDLFVLASAWEAFPLSVLEAMACGVPVLATRVGGIPEAVEPAGAGLLVPPGDGDALADGLERLLADPGSLASMGRSAAQAAAGRFTIDAMVEGTARVYESLLR